MRDAWQPLQKITTAINFFGHTHIQGGFATNDDDWFKLVPDYATHNEPEEYEIQLREGVRYLINPGSVGQPRDGDWRSAFAIYNDAQRTVTFYRIPYDVRLAQMRIIRAGLPDRLATRLRDGR
jgi:diadenosine tetraphosphatase ApaH/serine/threonine PP2A family protein phosphatase